MIIVDPIDLPWNGNYISRKNLPPKALEALNNFDPTDIYILARTYKVWFIFFRRHELLSKEVELEFFPYIFGES